jgi:glycosyltransferase involved in cell wall biosynthesis
MAPAVSVILPTRNRADQLRKTLADVDALTAPPGLTWEVVVIDNGSTDQTPAVAAVVADLDRRSPGRFRCVAEPVAGRSSALNAGVKAAAGQLLLFVDDDVHIEPDWLTEMTCAFAEERCLAVGGKILPVFLAGPPAWLAPGAPFPYRYDLGQTRHDTIAVFGANMGFRREVFERFGLFRDDLGIAPGDPMVGEESELCERIRKGGGRVLYVPTAVVHHPVTTQQASQAFLLTWHFHYGRSLARREPVPAGTVWWLDVPRYLWRDLVEHWIRWLFAFGAAVRFQHRLSIKRLWGEAVERRALRRWENRIFMAANRPGVS